MKRIVAIALAAGLLAILFVSVGPIRQNPAYHEFADRRTLFGVPNFWNVVSNLPFLLVALYGLRALGSPVAFLQRWERSAFAILLAGAAAVSAGSTYYHLHPDNATLFWDRLPMAVVFMSLVASLAGERIAMDLGRRLLAPLLVLGAAAVLLWRWTGDLRLYGLVQFGSMLAVLAILLHFPARYTAGAGAWWMAGLYGAAKIVELRDAPLGAWLPTGGHPCKHLLAAAALFAWVHSVAIRRLREAGKFRADHRSSGQVAV